MGQFVYMVPESAAASVLVKKYGLVDRLGDDPAQRGCRVAVKDDAPVALGAAADEVDCTCMGMDDERLGFFPARQQWKAIAYENTPCRYWIGFEVDDVPTPTDLLRPSIVDGHMVTLCDGNNWLVPVARSFQPDTTRLPQQLHLTAEGKVTKAVVPAYADLFARAEPIAAEVYGTDREPDGFGSVTMDEEDLFALVADALAVNYRVGKAEVDALGLMSTQTEAMVLRALIDMPSFERALETLKKEGGGD